MHYEGGVFRLHGFSEVIDILSEQAELDDDFWWMSEVIKAGQLPAQSIWLTVQKLEEVNFNDGVVPVDALQAKLTDLQVAARHYYCESVMAEIREANRFLTSRPGLFVVSTETNVSLTRMAVDADQQGMLQLKAYASDETEVAIAAHSLLINTAMLTSVEQQALGDYRDLYSQQ